MLTENNLPKYFLAEAVNTGCHVMNRLRLLRRTPYELWHDRKPNITLMSLDGNALFKITITNCINLIAKPMKALLLDSQQLVKHM